MLTNRQVATILWKLLLPAGQFFGLVPFTFHRKSRKFHRSKRWLAATVLQTLLIVTLSPVAAIVMMIKWFYSPNAPMANFLIINEMSLHIISVLLTYSIVLTNLATIQRSVNEFGALFADLAARDPHIFDDKLPRIYLHKIIIVDVVFLTATIATQVPLLVADYPLLVAWLVSSWIALQMKVIGILFQAVVVLGSLLYGSINRQISAAIGHLCRLDEREAPPRYRQRMFHIYSGFYVGTINHLHRSHRTTTRLVQQLVAFLSPGIVLLTIFQVMMIITEIYKLATLDFQHDSSLRLSSVMLPSLFVLVNTVQFCFNATICDRSTRKAEKASILLNEFFQFEVDERLDLSIQLFTTEMLHHSYGIEMCGLYTENLEFVVRVMGFTTTYLIILMQLKLS